VRRAISATAKFDLTGRGLNQRVSDQFGGFPCGTDCLLNLAGRDGPPEVEYAATFGELVQETGELLLIVIGLHQGHNGYALSQGEHSGMITSRYHNAAFSGQANDVLRALDLCASGGLLNIQQLADGHSDMGKETRLDFSALAALRSGSRSMPKIPSLVPA